MIVLVVILVLLTLGGMYLALRGLFPKREGQTPYCRKCGYNLTGSDRSAQGARCPECGTDVTEPKAVNVGERRVRRRRVAVGVICMLLGAVPLGTLGIGSLMKVDWYGYKPTGWVLLDGESDNAVLAARALNEMTRRAQAGRLTPEQTARLAEICLSEQARPTLRLAVNLTGVHLLDWLYGQGLLNAEQTERFFANMVQFSVAVRPVVVVGQKFYAGVKLQGRGPVSKYRLRVRVREICVGDQERRRLAGGRSFTGYTSISEMNIVGYPTILHRPGRHSVSADIAFQIDVRGSGNSWASNGSALYSGQRTVTGEVEVLVEEPPDLLKMTHSEELDRAVAAVMLLSEFRAGQKNGRPGPPGESAMRVWLSFPHSRPIGLAFDVFAQFDNQRVNLRQVTASTDRWGAVGRGFSLRHAGEIPSHITFVLRSSKAAALLTADLFEIWDGELWFEDIEVLAQEDPPGWPRQGRFKPRVRRRDPSSDELSWPAAGVFLPELGIVDVGRIQESISEPLLGVPPYPLTGLTNEQLSELVEEAMGGRTRREIEEQAAAADASAAVDSLTPDEKQRFFSDMLDLSLRVRPVVVREQEFFVGVTYEDHGLKGAFQVHLKLEEIRLGNEMTLQPLSTLSAPGGLRFNLSLPGLGIYTTLERPGEWPVEADVAFQIDKAGKGPGWVTDGSELYSESRTVSGVVKVLVDEPPDLFKLTHSPQLDDAVAAIIRATEFRVGRDALSYGPGADVRLSGTVWLHSPRPIGLAFEAYAEFDNQRYSLGQIIAPKGGQSGSSHGSSVSCTCAGDIPSQITLILRSSKQAALRTADLYEIWDGQLRFEGVKVVPDDGRRPRRGRYVGKVVR